MCKRLVRSEAFCEIINFIKGWFFFAVLFDIFAGKFFSFFSCQLKCLQHRDVNVFVFTRMLVRNIYNSFLVFRTKFKNFVSVFAGGGGGTFVLKTIFAAPDQFLYSEYCIVNFYCYV